MPKILYSVAEPESVTSASTGWHCPVVSGGGDAVGSLEVRAAYPHQVAGTFRKLGINITTNTFTGSNHATFVLRRDTGGGPADTAVTVQITAGQTGVFESASNLSVTINAGDLINTKLTTPAEVGATLTYRVVWIEFEPSSTYAYHMGAFANWSVAAGAARWAGPMGPADDSTVEAAESLRMTGAGTITHVLARNMLSQADGIVSWTLSIGGVDSTNKIISVAAGAAEANYLVSTGTDTYADNDAVTFQYAEGGTGNSDWSFLQMVVQPTLQKFEMGSARLQSVSAGGAVEYVAIADLTNSSATEGPVQLRAPFAMTITDLRVYARTNGITTTDTVVAFRVNGADRATCTIDATGWHDDGHTAVSVAAGDLINFSITPGTGGTTDEINKIMVTVADATATAGAGGPISSINPFYPFPPLNKRA